MEDTNLVFLAISISLFIVIIIVAYLNKKQVNNFNKRAAEAAKIKTEKYADDNEAADAGSVEINTEAHAIVCPFCYEEFSPTEVSFYFPFKDSDGNTVDIYLPVDGRARENVNFCAEKGLYSVFQVDNSGNIPLVMQLYTRGYNKMIMSSPIRVCRNCHKPLSKNAGAYSPDNGVFLIGLRGSGKTVFITTVIKRLSDILPKYFGVQFNPYNKDIEKEYREKYYNIIFKDKELPAATINEAQITYEVMGKRTVGITFSDIKGEISDDTKEIFLGNFQKVVWHSNYFVLTVDIEDIYNNSDDKSKTINIITDVLRNAVPNEQERQKKYLAVVLTKSDKLVGLENKKIFDRGSIIYKDINYEEVRQDIMYFFNERNYINEQLRGYLNEKYSDIVLAAENAFGYDHVNYFAVSAIGQEPVNGRLDGVIMPRRVEEPILWLLLKNGDI